jgi:hypothetical protein
MEPLYSGHLRTVNTFKSPIGVYYREVLLYFVSPIFLAYFIGLIPDSCTKPLIGTVISIVAKIIIDYNTHLTPWIWSCFHTSAFNIDDAYDFIYKCRYMGVIVLFGIFQFFIVLMYGFYCINIR